MSFTQEHEQFLTLLDKGKSITLAARELGINRNTAYGWARKAGISSKRAQDHRKAEFLKLRREGLNRQDAATRVAVNIRTARDWDQGIRRLKRGRLYPDGTFADYTTSETIMESMTTPPPVVPEQVGTRLLSLIEREKIADLRAARACICHIPRIATRPRAGHARSRPNSPSRVGCAIGSRPSSWNSGRPNRSATR